VTPPVLELSDVDLSYGPFRALFGVSLAVPENCAVGLVGPNGAGKTSVARAVSGLVRPSRGVVRLDGLDVTRWPAWRIARAGLVHVPEGRSVLGSLTVEENLLLGFENLGGRRATAEALVRAYDRFERLARRRHQTAGTLSGGEQRMLALARALGLPQRLLVVDELSLGLAPAVTDEIFAALRDVVAGGTSLLVIEQHTERVFTLAERVVLLLRGRVVAQGTAGEMAPVVASLMPPAPAPEVAV
jgi:branched-chain amino acid transport system ATP-binding protein